LAGGWPAVRPSVSRHRTAPLTTREGDHTQEPSSLSPQPPRGSPAGHVLPGGIWTTQEWTTHHRRPPFLLPFASSPSEPWRLPPRSDCIMGLWNAPTPVKRHEQHAAQGSMTWEGDDPYHPCFVLFRHPRIGLSHAVPSVVGEEDAPEPTSSWFPSSPLCFPPPPPSLPPWHRPRGARHAAGRPGHAAESRKGRPEGAVAGAVVPSGADSPAPSSPSSRQRGPRRSTPRGGRGGCRS